MRWYNGGIAEAVGASKSKGAIFVVYIEGNDEKSQQFSTLIESEEISPQLGSDNFVAIKLEANSVPHQQFSEIYKQTPIPSIYFIGKNGLPLKIVTEAPDSSTLSKEINEVLDKAGFGPVQSTAHSSASASQCLINTEQSSSKPPNVVCENGVCTIKRDPTSSSEETSKAEGESATISAEEKLERAKKLLEAKRLQKEQEEKENEIRKELERRKMGQEVQKMKQWQEDQELKQLKEEREREKKQEREARERVLAQIAQDKADRAAKFKPAAASTPTNKEPVAGTSKSDSNTAKLQFKMPDGSSKTQEFPSTDKLQSVVNYIKANLNLSSSKFTLSTTFPRRQFTETDYSQTLSELQLTPNAVILVLPLSHGTVSTNQGVGGVSGFVWTLLAPLIGLFNFVKLFLGFGNSGGASASGGDQPSGGYSGGNRSNSVIHVRSKYDLENRLKSAGSKLVVIDFFATWCGPCKMIAPELERMAKDFPNVVFLKVDVDENGDISRGYGVSSMPTFLFIKNRREVTRFSGADSYQLRSTVQRYR